MEIPDRHLLPPINDSNFVFFLRTRQGGVVSFRFAQRAERIRKRQTKSGTAVGFTAPASPRKGIVSLDCDMAPLARVVATVFQWEDDRLLRTPWHETVV
jgi:hypothetical protein